MSKKRKRIVSSILAAMFVAGNLGMSVKADYLYPSTTKTSGGTNGYVSVKTGAYIEYYHPYSSVTVAKYGAKAEITTASSLTTNFSMSGYLFLNGPYDPVPFLCTGNVNSIMHTEYTHYSYCSGNTSTNSTAFGSSSQNFSGNF